ncbi:MAG: hypothetical protein WKF77_17065 [Planctomycetaceae bacterium]
MDEHLPLNMFPQSVSASLISGGYDTLARDGTPFRVISATLPQTSPGGVQTIPVAMNRDQHHAHVQRNASSLAGAVRASDTILGRHCMKCGRRSTTCVVKLKSH